MYHHDIMLSEEATGSGVRPPPLWKIFGIRFIECDRNQGQYFVNAMKLRGWPALVKTWFAMQSYHFACAITETLLGCIKFHRQSKKLGLKQGHLAINLGETACQTGA